MSIVGIGGQHFVAKDPQVATEACYVDQSHLSRDFRTLADMTATQWLAERPDVIPTSGR
ncbi:MAG: hypothetical protein ACRDRH_24130 [Pseudonocardia sp.]